MEGAITSGLKAADAVQRAEGLRRPVRIRKPHLPAWWLGLLGVGTYGLVPVAAAALGVSWGRVWLTAVRRWEKRHH